MCTVNFYETNLNPSGKKRFYYADTAVNSAAIAAGITWQEAVKLLIEQCHIRSNMPKYITCVTDMMKALGFKRIGYTAFPSEIAKKAIEEGSKGRYILMYRHYGYLAMVPEKDGSYAIRGITDMKSDVTARLTTEVWEYFPGTDNRSGIYKDNKREHTCEENKALLVKNLNPKGKIIGDCVVRGLSGTLDCSWHDAMDYLAMASDYSEPLINSIPNIHLTLKELGLEYHKSRTKRGDYTGKEFCEKMSRTYFNGERIFAFVGPNHCAAVLPVENEDGSISYKIQDTWDSSVKRVSDYWVYKPKKAAPAFVNTHKVNDKVVHPVFGEGTVLKINESEKGCILEIDFHKRGIKRISASWFSKKEICSA